MKRTAWGPLQKKRLLLLSVVVAIACGLGLTVLIGRPLLRYAAQPERFRAWVDSHGALGRLAFVLMVVVQILIALIPGEPFELLAGYAFGAVEGTVLCLLAAALGSVLVFWLVRRFGVPLVEVYFPREKVEKLRFLRRSKRRDLIFLLIYLLPGTPKDLLSYVAGLTDIRLSVWLLICSLGRLPSILTSTIGGDALGTKSYGFAAAVFAVTLALSALGLAAYHAICKRRNGT